MFEITKKDIEELTPTLLAELVRQLVHCTVSSSDTPKEHFPIDIYQPGWDGQLTYEKETPWIPQGHSFWEYSTGKKNDVKFEENFTKRTEGTSEKIRKESTFVFVTSQKKWAQKKIDEKKQDKKGWKCIYIHFSKDLEEWLSRSEALKARVWLANKIGKPTAGLISADVAWERWAKSGSKRPIPQSMILADRDASVEKLSKFLGNKPTDFFTVYADSREEATAFVCASLLRKDGVLNEHASKLIVVDEKPENIRTLISPVGGKNLVFLLKNQEMARGIGDLSNQVHIIIAEHISNDNQNMQPNNGTVLRRVSNQKFEEMLVKKMDYSETQAMQTARHYGMSVTVFWRHYSTNPAIKNPKWASDDNADIMIAAALAGGWDSSNEHDRNFMEAISGHEYLEIEKRMSIFLNKDDSPVEKWGSIWQIKSRFDALSVAYNRISIYMLNRFLPKVHTMLLNRQQKESRKLFLGVMNTLPILSNLFDHRQDIESKSEIQRAVKAMLADDSPELFGHEELSLLAETAPEVFLDTLKNDLDSFGKKEWEQRNICWALQVLAWEERYVDHIVDILLQLIEHKNFGSGVLSSFFIPWLPQCGASIASRKQLLDGIVKNHPDIGWELCISMLRQDTAVQNSMPKWRNMPSSTKMLVTRKEIKDAVEFAFLHAMSLLNNDVGKIVKMIESIPRLPHEQISKLVRTIESSDSIENISPDKAVEIQNTLRGMPRRFEDLAAQEKSKEGKEIFSKLQKELDLLYHFLSPKDIVQKHLWLFLSHWPDFPRKRGVPIDEIEQSLKEERRKVIGEILQSKGHNGLWEMYELNSMMFFVGESLPKEWDDAKRFKCMLDLVPRFKEHNVRGIFIRGIFYLKMKEDPNFVCDSIAQGKHKKWGRDTTLAFVLSDFSSTRKLWEMIDRDIPEIASDYWENMSSFGQKSPEDLAYFIQKKIEHGQAHIAVHDAVISRFAGMNGQQVAKILEAMPDKKKVSDSLGHYIEESFLYIVQKGDVEEDKILNLEFQYYQYMGQVKPRGIFRKLALDPNYFVQKVGHLINFPSDKSKMQKYFDWESIMRQWRTPPGTRKDESFCEEDFMEWISEVRKLTSGDIDLQKEADDYIGKMLVHLPKSDDLPLPKAALDLLSQGYAEEIRNGFISGESYPEGAFWVGSGGDGERKQAKKYEEVAKKLEEKGYPRVATIYREIARDYTHRADREDLRARINTD